MTRGDAANGVGWLGTGYLIFEKVWDRFHPTTTVLLQAQYAENLRVLGESLQACLGSCQ